MPKRSDLPVPKLVFDDKRPPQGGRKGPKSKSLIYGMKTREESTGPVKPSDPAPHVPMKVTRQQAKAPSLAKTAEIIVAPSPKGAIPPGGFGRTRRTAVTVQTPTRKVCLNYRLSLIIPQPPPDDLQGLQTTPGRKKPPQYATGGARSQAPSIAGSETGKFSTTTASSEGKKVYAKERRSARLGVMTRKGSG